MIAKEILDGVVGVISQVDQQIADLQAFREEQVKLLLTYDPTGETTGTLSTAASPGQQRAPASAPQSGSAASGSGTTAEGDNNVAASTAPSHTPNTEASGAASGKTDVALPAGTTTGRGRGGGRRASKGKQDASSSTTAKQGDKAPGEKPARKPRGPNKKANAQAPHAAKANTPAAPPLPPESGTGAQTPAALTSSQIAAGTQGISPEIWPTLLTGRGKSATDLARAAIRQLKLDGSKETITKLANEAETALEKLIPSGGVKAHGEGAARVFTRD
jgi:hypothetical protein